MAYCRKCCDDYPESAVDHHHAPCSACQSDGHAPCQCWGNPYDRALAAEAPR